MSTADDIELVAILLFALVLVALGAYGTFVMVRNTTRKR
jgi:hypothetical protein